MLVLDCLDFGNSSARSMVGFFDTRSITNPAGCQILISGKKPGKMYSIMCQYRQKIPFLKLKAVKYHGPSADCVYTLRPRYGRPCYRRFSLPPVKFLGKSSEKSDVLGHILEYFHKNVKL